MSRLRLGVSARFDGSGTVVAATARSPGRPPRHAIRRHRARAMLFAFVAVLLSPTKPHTSNLIWPALLLAWIILGVGYSTVMTPSGRLLRRSAHPADRPAVFAEQFALSHACWLLTYPLAGWLGSSVGILPTLLVLAALTLMGVLIAPSVWPVIDADVIPHQHPELPSGHPHLDGKPSRHAHAYVIGNLHNHWP
jgi:hypothetical protein